MKDWRGRGVAVLNELLVMIACSSLVCAVLLSCGVSYMIAERAISISSLIVWVIYVSNYPHVANKQTGMENEQMIAMRCVKFRHSFYKVAQSAVTLYVRS